jgi:hypothetical protein
MRKQAYHASGALIAQQCLLHAVGGDLHAAA